MLVKLLVFLLLTTPLLAKTYGDFRVTEINSVIDGDTIKVTLENVHPLLGDRIPVRLTGVDTPELSSTNKKVQALALEAKEFVTNLLATATDIRLNNTKRDKYFRILADVIVDGQNLADLLIEKGLGLPYNGETKPDWNSKIRKRA